MVRKWWERDKRLATHQGNKPNYTRNQAGAGGRKLPWGAATGKELRYIFTDP